MANDLNYQSTVIISLKLLVNIQYLMASAHAQTKSEGMCSDKWSTDLTQGSNIS